MFFSCFLSSSTIASEKTSWIEGSFRLISFSWASNNNSDFIVKCKCSTDFIVCLFLECAPFFVRFYYILHFWSCVATYMCFAVKCMQNLPHVKTLFLSLPASFVFCFLPTFYPIKISKCQNKPSVNKFAARRKWAGFYLVGKLNGRTLKADRHFSVKHIFFSCIIHTCIYLLYITDHTDQRATANASPFFNMLPSSDWKLVKGICSRINAYDDWHSAVFPLLCATFR